MATVSETVTITSVSPKVPVRTSIWVTVAVSTGSKKVCVSVTVNDSANSTVEK